MRLLIIAIEKKKLAKKRSPYIKQGASLSQTISDATEAGKKQTFNIATK
jgi:hypothetical protein